MVAWEDDAGLHLDGIGDGGFLLQFEPESKPMACLPVSNKPVTCVGPRSPQCDADYRLRFAFWHQFSMFTDGLTHVMDQRQSLLEQAHRLSAQQANLNPASMVVGDILRHDAHRIHDNVSLFTARRGEL